MALKIRLSRKGSTHNPVYRLVVAEANARRDGRFVEILGTYNPKSAGPQLQFHLDRIEHWEKVGAKPTDTAKSLIAKARAASTAAV